MKDQINEQEGMDIILDMISKTTSKIGKGDGNIMLVMGYATLVLSFVIGLSVLLTEHNAFYLLWFLLGVPAIIFAVKNKKNDVPKVKTYIDAAIASVWKVVNMCFLFTIAVLFYFWIFESRILFWLMMPFSLIYTSIGVAITGVVIRDKYLSYVPLVSLACGFCLLCVPMVFDIQRLDVIFNFLLGINFIFMMIIPGYILNRKARKNA